MPSPRPTNYLIAGGNGAGNKSKKSRWNWVLWLAVIGALALAAKAFDLRQLLQGTLDWIGSLGAWGPVIFIAIYIIATVLLIPGSILTLGAGALFGIVYGSIYVTIAATLGATCAFFVGRQLARGSVAKKIEGNAKFKAIDDAVAREGWKIVGLTRLSPILPFTLLNYAFGLTRVSLRDYFFASCIGMIPGTILYVYLGSLIGSVASVGAKARTRTPAEWGLYVFGLLATVGVTVYVTRVARRALDERIAR